MIDVHMGHDQRAHVVDRELDRELVGVRTLAGGLRALEKAAVDQDRVVGARPQLMARTGNATDGAVVENFHLHEPGPAS